MGTLLRYREAAITGSAERLSHLFGALFVTLSNDSAADSGALPEGFGCRHISRQRDPLVGPPLEGSDGRTQPLLANLVSDSVTPDRTRRMTVLEVWTV